MDHVVTTLKDIVRIYYKKINVQTTPENEYDVRKNTIREAIIRASPGMKNDVLFNTLFPSVFGIVYCEDKLRKQSC